MVCVDLVLRGSGVAILIEKELWRQFVGLLAFSDRVRVKEDRTYELPHVREVCTYAYVASRT